MTALHRLITTECHEFSLQTALVDILLLVDIFRTGQKPYHYFLSIPMVPQDNIFPGYVFV